ncbi:MAG: CoxG family protein [Rhizomicrobium sp.]
MIETEQTVAIDVAIEGVWNYVQDIRRWANLMPGMRECTVIDADNSRWMLKVGVGGLVRTVNVLVHVDQWDGPERATFSYKLEGDPVQGGGTYTASRQGPHETEVKLVVRVEGSGPMAPMWEAMGRPLLPQLAKGFGGQLKAEIERTVGASGPRAAAATDAPAPFASIGKWLSKLWGTIFGSAAR